MTPGRCQRCGCPRIRHAPNGGRCRFADADGRCTCWQYMAVSPQECPVHWPDADGRCEFCRAPLEMV